MKNFGLMIRKTPAVVFVVLLFGVLLYPALNASRAQAVILSTCYRENSNYTKVNCEEAARIYPGFNFIAGLCYVTQNEQGQVRYPGVTTCGSPSETSTPAAALEGKWIDKVAITLGTAIYRDQDPFRAPDHYKQVGVKCSHTLEVTGDTTAVLKKQKTVTVGQDSECTPDGQENITLSGAENRNITAYKYTFDNDEIIFVPAYFVKTGPSVTDFTDGYFANDGVFKRLPKEASKYNDNHYFLYRSNSYNPIEEQSESDSKNCANETNPYDCGGTRVDGDHLETQYCNDSWGPGDGCQEFADSMGLTFKSTAPDKSVYNNAPGAGINDPDNPTTPDGEAAGPTCESKSKLSIGWLLCAALEGLDSMLVGTDGKGGMLAIVNNLLSVQSDMYDQAAVKAMWSYFRNLATFLLIMIGLVMIIGQAISKE